MSKNKNNPQVDMPLRKYGLKRMIVSEEVSRTKKQRIDAVIQSLPQLSASTAHFEEDFLENLMKNINKEAIPSSYGTMKRVPKKKELFSEHALKMMNDFKDYMKQKNEGQTSILSSQKSNISTICQSSSMNIDMKENIVNRSQSTTPATIISKRLSDRDFLTPKSPIISSSKKYSHTMTSSNSINSANFKLERTTNIDMNLIAKDMSLNDRSFVEMPVTCVYGEDEYNIGLTPPELNEP